MLRSSCVRLQHSCPPRVHAILVVPLLDGILSHPRMVLHVITLAPLLGAMTIAAITAAAPWLDGPVLLHVSLRL